MAEMNRLSVRTRSERGAELIEFALVLPLLLMIVLGIVDFGFMFQRLEVVTNAAREGARLAVLPGYDEPDVQERVENYLLNGGLNVSNSNYFLKTRDVKLTPNPITVGSDTIDGERVEVVYYHQYLFLSGIAGWFGGAFSSVPLRGTAVMQDEGGS